MPADADLAGPLYKRAPAPHQRESSARHFLQSDLVQQCRAVLYETQLSNSSLNLEVTESAMIPDPETAIELMNQLKISRDQDFPG